MFVVTTAEMRELDRLTIEVHGTPGHVLMERAGAGAAHVFWDRFPGVRTRPVVVAGKGNNGGDGFVVARHLGRRGVRCDVVLLARAEDLRGDAARNLRAFVRGRGRLVEAPGAAAVPAVRAALGRSRVVIDAIFGTGLNAPVDGPIAEVIALVNASGLPVFAVDMPSGLDGDSGQPLGVAVQAEVTATFGFPKLGQVLYPGAGYVGTLGVVDIGIAPQAVSAVAPSSRLLTMGEVGRLFPRRPADAHKGDAGHAFIVAGGRGKCGAAVLAAEAAVRAGAGLTTLAVPESERAGVAMRLREVMTAGLRDAGDGVFAAPTPADLAAVSSRKTSVTVGPGIGVSAGTRALVEALVTECPLPLVIDADALNCLAGNVALLRRRAGPTVLTPHPGEMARLVAASVTQVQADRVGMAKRLALESGACIVLKGARTTVAAPNGSVGINVTGNPGMASGGMGDVLAGVIGALCAQGLDAVDAAAVGVHVHGLAADLAAASLGGEIGIIASDVIARLPAAIARVQEVAAADDPPATTDRSAPGHAAGRRRRGRARPPGR
jgi:NAD(P)H-hydrate epimerase